MSHPVIDDTARIGARTRVWQFASVIRGARIGTDCNIASCAIIDGAEIGDRCLIGHGASVNPGAVLHDDVFVGPNATLCNDRWPCVSKDGFRGDLFRRGFVAVLIKSGAAICANAVVLPGVTIGKQAIVAASATAHCDVPDGYLFARDGSMVKIKDEWRARRMHEIKSELRKAC